MLAVSHSLYELQTEQQQFFDDNGFLILRRFYQGEELQALQDSLYGMLRDPSHARPGVRPNAEPPESAADQLRDPRNPERIWMVMDSPLIDDVLYRHLKEPRLCRVMSDLLGPNLNFHNGKARIKPPGYASHQFWHQDWPYERHSTPDLAAAITYLDATWEGAAGTQVIPGSHHLGELPADERHQIDHGAIEKLLAEAEVVTMDAEPGDLLIIHVQAVHRAGPNRTDQTRSCIINEYKTMEALDEWGNQCAFADMPLMRHGAPI